MSGSPDNFDSFSPCDAFPTGQDARLYVSQNGRRYIATPVRDAVL